MIGGWPDSSFEASMAFFPPLNRGPTFVYIDAALEQSGRIAPQLQQKSQRFSEFFPEAATNNVDLDTVILKGHKDPLEP
jgi:hypothetical protein